MSEPPAAQESLVHAWEAIALAREGVRQMNTALAEASWFLEQARAREVADLCEGAAAVGRVVARHIGNAVEDVRMVRSQTDQLPASTRQDEVDRLALRARLDKIEEDLGQVRPLLNESVVRLAGVADYLQQQSSESTTAAVTGALVRPLSGAAKDGVTIQQELANVHSETGRAHGQVNAICEVARARMRAVREDHHSPGGGPAPTVAVP